MNAPVNAYTYDFAIKVAKAEGFIVRRVPQHSPLAIRGYRYNIRGNRSNMYACDENEIVTLVRGAVRNSMTMPPMLTLERQAKELNEMADLLDYHTGERPSDEDIAMALRLAAGHMTHVADKILRLAANA